MMNAITLADLETLAAQKRLEADEAWTRKSAAEKALGAEWHEKRQLADALDMVAKHLSAPTEAK